MSSKLWRILGGRRGDEIEQSALGDDAPMSDLIEDQPRKATWGEKGHLPKSSLF